MGTEGAAYTSGNWVAKVGMEDAFIEAWKAFVSWSIEHHDGFVNVMLIRQDTDPRHFVSLGAWDSHDSVAAWRNHPEFPAKLGAARELCESFAALDYHEVFRLP